MSNTVKEILTNAVNGLISSAKAADLHVNVKYHNGFEEVVWFKSNSSAAIFQNAINEVNKARKLELGEAYSD